MKKNALNQTLTQKITDEKNALDLKITNEKNALDLKITNEKKCFRSKNNK